MIKLLYHVVLLFGVVFVHLFYNLGFLYLIIIIYLRWTHFDGDNTKSKESTKLLF